MAAGEKEIPEDVFREKFGGNEFAAARRRKLESNAVRAANRHLWRWFVAPAVFSIAASAAAWLTYYGQ